ncbi:MAG: ion transporter [Candidatus Dadabacteria bacterium]|nr:ion transporter [Candidatus Dadabacteria bacterium]NIS10058.1 ion transporter [Candidatus Dadabacteria bacterium]NIV42135.1 ion transporter [Candidatus Dadabacteria bacterium]NIX16444.1 ion transporter [Candidatus Dadabacteria bacterium]NIY23005.1 ion transporter [Candidatus Dadabacteria bacterium]
MEQVPKQGQEKENSSFSNLRFRLHEVIFEADTPLGKIFDIVLITSIVLSVIFVMLDSVSSIRGQYGSQLYLAEWFFTILFTLEYILRLYCVGNRLKYATSFFGAVDLIAIVPTYLSLLVPGSQYFLVVRLLRILRIFRVLKLAHYVGESALLAQALVASRRKIFVFLLTVLTLVTILGSLMYLVEGEENGFSSIPKSIYWAIVTITTVGYGDVAPTTDLGRFIASIIMIIGYSIIAIPTGIVTVEFANAFKKNLSTQLCIHCNADGHDTDAKYCKYCGSAINPKI